jgi:selenium metabolism protein YedF
MLETTVVVLGSANIGRGDDTLGAVLTRNFLRMLRDNEPRPATLIFINTGVRLTTEGTPVLEEMLELEKLGVELLSCGTCLDFFNIREKLIAGRASNMGEIYAQLGAAGKVISM